MANYAFIGWFNSVQRALQEASIPTAKILIDHGFIPVLVYNNPDINDKINLPDNWLTVDLDEIHCHKVTSIDWDFVQEYERKRYGSEESLKTHTKIFRFYCFAMDLLKPNDVLIAPNSGNNFSRTLHQASIDSHAKFLYSENFYFKDQHQFSSIPFLKTKKYGQPELYNIFCNSQPNVKAEEWLREYRQNRTSKYAQVEENITENFDIFVPGQLSWDTNVIMVTKEFLTTADLAINLAKENPEKKIAYKLHPKIDNKVIEDAEKKSLEPFQNIKIVEGSIIEILEHSKILHVLSSTVGIEAQLRNREVAWHSLSLAVNFGLQIEENRLKFVSACLDYMVDEQNLYQELMNKLDRI